MKKNIATTFFLLWMHCFVFAQTDIKTYVQQNTVQIKKIQPDSIDYTGFESIGNAIGDASVVMLGEQDHGDAPTFIAKTKLIQYLHEKKGFNVLAFESDFFALNQGWDHLPKDEQGIYNFLRKNITAVWPYCDACQYLFKELIPKSFLTGSPIQISGFDNQLFLNYSFKNLSRDVDSVMRKENFTIINNNNSYTTLLSIIDTLAMAPFTPKPESFYMHAADEMQLLKKELLARFDENNFWCIVTDNLIHYCRQMSFALSDDRSRNERDLQMAANLNWLIKYKYPKQKIIVWAQNYHVSKYAGHYERKVFNKLQSMGSAFTSNNINAEHTYIIGFTSYTGKAGRTGMNIYDVETPGKNSFESWISEKDDFAFTDFRKFNTLNADKEVSFKMNGSVVDVIHKPYSAPWTHIFDGVFFIRNMYPCKLAR